MSAEARARLQALREQVAYHDRRYHAEDEPEISDAEYDALKRELEALEAAHPDAAGADSPSQRVGARPVAKFAPVRHALPMLSPMRRWGTSCAASPRGWARKHRVSPPK